MAYFFQKGNTKTRVRKKKISHKDKNTKAYRGSMMENTQAAVQARISEEKNKEQEKQKKEIAKAYGKYAKEFTPRPKYFGNCLKAFLTGGAVCTAALAFQNYLEGKGISEKDAGAFVTIALVMTAQLLTGLGVFDVIAKFAGAGVIVPITGFSNSMVAPAIEYKKEGPVLGVGSKLFSVAGPVLVCGISAATAVGIIYWIKSLL